MEIKLQKALENVEMTYSDIVEIANDILSEFVKDVNDIISTITSKEILTNDEIRMYMLKLSCKAFSFSEVKEKSSMKAEIAEAIRKEKYAKTFNSIEGTVAFKENSSTIEITNEILVECVHNLVSSLFKTKLDEIHRVVDTLRTILVSRNAEAKLSQDGLE